MSPQLGKEKGERRTRSLLAGLFALAVALFTASAVYAGLTADATGSEGVNSGVLSLVLSADAPSGGFSNFVGPMAPGDVNNVVVNLVNNGTLANGGSVNLTVAGVPANALTDGTAAGEGLAVSITTCGVAWTYAPGSATCSSGSSVVLAQTMVSAMSGSVAIAGSALAPGGAINHLLVSVTLVGTENTHNGVIPSPGIQGLSTTLNFTFSEQQRLPVTVNQ
jgi:hypothetical protein